MRWAKDGHYFASTRFPYPCSALNTRLTDSSRFDEPSAALCERAVLKDVALSNEHHTAFPSNKLILRINPMYIYIYISVHLPSLRLRYMHSNYREPEFVHPDRGDATKAEGSSPRRPPQERSDAQLSCDEGELHPCARQLSAGSRQRRRAGKRPERKRGC